MDEAICKIGRYPVFVESRKVLMVWILTGHDMHACVGKILGHVRSFQSQRVFQSKAGQVNTRNMTIQCEVLGLSF